MSDYGLVEYNEVLRFQLSLGASMSCGTEAARVTCGASLHQWNDVGLIGDGPSGRIMSRGVILTLAMDNVNIVGVDPIREASMTLFEGSFFEQYETYSAVGLGSISTTLDFINYRLYARDDFWWLAQWDSIEWKVDGVLQWSTSDPALISVESPYLSPVGIPMKGFTVVATSLPAANPVVAFPHDNSTGGVSVSATAVGGYTSKIDGTWFADPISIPSAAPFLTPAGSYHSVGSLVSAPSGSNTANVTVHGLLSGHMIERYSEEVAIFANLDKGWMRFNERVDEFHLMAQRRTFPRLRRRNATITNNIDGLSIDPLSDLVDETIYAESSYMVSAIGTDTHVMEDVFDEPTICLYQRHYVGDFGDGVRFGTEHSCTEGVYDVQKLSYAGSDGLEILDNYQNGGFNPILDGSDELAPHAARYCN